MNIEQLLKIAEEENLPPLMKGAFVYFFMRRFPDEKFVPYIREWCVRFKTGHPETWMDQLSKDWYEQAITFAEAKLEP